MGGYGASFQPEVYQYDPSTTLWSTLTNLQNNANVDLGRDRFGAALTPYGLVQVAGGNTPSIFSVYYPHAIMTTAPTYGETLALPNTSMTNLKDNAAVCHYSRKDKKWYLYRIGGGSSAGSPDDTGYQRFDFDANAWAGAVDLDDTVYTEKSQPAACSWGDEIFVFGGSRGGSRTPAAAAWNPDGNAGAGNYRVLRDVGSTVEDPDTRTCMMTAVPCGPYIYLIDGADVPAGSGGIRRIRRYTP